VSPLHTRKVVFFALMISMLGCANQPKSNGLALDDFKNSFLKDCQSITGIEELHSGSCYTVNNTYEGNFTRQNVSLFDMLAWLNECGRDIRLVSQKLE